MAREEGHLSPEEGARYRVFGSNPASAFAGNPTTLIECGRLPPQQELLARSRALPTVDNAFFAPAAPRAWRVRFFSHTAELLVCGHALLALAHHLGEREGKKALLLESPYHLHRARWRAGEPSVSLPAWDCRQAPDRLLGRLLEAAGLHVEHLALCSQRVWLARCAEPGEIAAFEREGFDWQALALLAPGALILTAPLGPREYAFRYFAPWHGKPEDSATGSAQCRLAPYWLGEGEEGLARQLSPAGEARMKVERDGRRVWLSGRVEKAP